MEKENFTYLGRARIQQNVFTIVEFFRPGQDLRSITSRDCTLNKERSIFTLLVISMTFKSQVTFELIQCIAQILIHAKVVCLKQTILKTLQTCSGSTAPRLYNPLGAPGISCSSS